MTKIWTMTKRGINGRLRPLCLLLVLAASTVPAGAQAPTEDASDPVRVLIVGGDQHHDFDQWFGEVDSATLEAAGAEATYTENPKHILPALETLDVLRLTNNQPLPGSDLRDGIFNFVGAGKGLLIDHAGAWYSWADWPAFNRDLVGGGVRGHRAYGTFAVAVADTTHPVMAGVPETFTIEDELYRLEQDPEGPALHVLATAQDPETGDVFPVVWTVAHTNGRIVVNTLGHDGAAHHHPAYRQILQNSLRWAGRRDQQP